MSEVSLLNLSYDEIDVDITLVSDMHKTRIMIARQKHEYVYPPWKIPLATFTSKPPDGLPAPKAIRATCESN